MQDTQTQVSVRSEHAVDFLRAHLQQVVTIHQAMFDKLLFADDAALGRDLATLFRDAGKTYLQLSDRIDRSCAQPSLQD
jgi:hypothetical protein